MAKLKYFFTDITQPPEATRNRGHQADRLGVIFAGESMTLRTTVRKVIFFIILFFSMNIYAAQSSCENKIFANLSAKKYTTISEVIDQVAVYCSLSVVVRDDATERALEKSLNITNMKNFTLAEILDFLLKDNNIYYELKNSILKISTLQTETFKVDYIRTIRSGSNNTQVTPSPGPSSQTTTPQSTSNQNMQAPSSNTGSASITNSDALFDFWASVSDNMAKITGQESNLSNGGIIINKEAGLITVTSTPEKIQKIREYLAELKQRLHRQVLIDVKILSVNLDNAHKTGIDWSNLQNGIAKPQLTLGHSSSATQYGGGTSLGDMAYSNVATVLNSATFDLKGVLNFLGTYGDVKSLSNPKILTLNNQPALISSGDTYYYKTTGTVTSSAGGTTGTTTSNESIGNVFAGVMLSITPQILDDESIIINVNPAVTSPRDSSLLASPQGGATATRNIPPDMRVKQISSIVKARDGDNIILGGLISDDRTNKTNKVKLLGDIPLLGYLFKSEEETRNYSELVLIITPHIVKESVVAKQTALSGILSVDIDREIDEPNISQTQINEQKQGGEPSDEQIGDKKSNEEGSLLSRYKEMPNVDTAVVLSKHYFSTGEYQKARKWALEANALDIKNEQSWILFARSSFRLGRKSEAMKVLEGYIQDSNSSEAKQWLSKMRSSK